VLWDFDRREQEASKGVTRVESNQSGSSSCDCTWFLHAIASSHLNHVPFLWESGHSRQQICHHLCQETRVLTFCTIPSSLLRCSCKRERVATADNRSVTTFAKKLGYSLFAPSPVACWDALHTYSLNTDNARRWKCWLQSPGRPSKLVTLKIKDVILREDVEEVCVWYGKFCNATIF
jgi:hypothetical protein